MQRLDSPMPIIGRNSSLPTYREQEFPSAAFLGRRHGELEEERRRLRRPMELVVEGRAAKMEARSAGSIVGIVAISREVEEIEGDDLELRDDDGEDIEARESWRYGRANLSLELERDDQAAHSHDTKTFGDDQGGESPGLTPGTQKILLSFWALEEPVFEYTIVYAQGDPVSAQHGETAEYEASYDLAAARISSLNDGGGEGVTLSQTAMIVADEPTSIAPLWSPSPDQEIIEDDELHLLVAGELAEAHHQPHSVAGVLSSDIGEANVAEEDLREVDIVNRLAK